MSELLRVESLCKKFGGVVANKDVSFSLEAGAKKCVIGPNGAGKTTFVSMISGHQAPDSGAVFFKDRNVTGWPVHKVAQAGIVRKFQTPVLYHGLTVAENLEMAVLGTGRARRDRRQRVEEVASLVSLADRLDQRVSTLPYGYAQWLDIGLLLARDAELLLLDEPTAGMSSEETVRTEELIRQLVDDLGFSAIIIEHDIGFIRSLQAPVMVLHLGSIIAEGSMGEIEADEQVRRIYLGEEG
jgi:ABC-type uncharacterized transport system ATPase subunit